MSDSCDHRNCSLPGSSVHGILFFFFFIGFFRQEYWSGLPFPSSGDLLDPENEPRSPAVQADSLPTELRGKPQSDSCSVMSTLCNPKDYTVHGILQARILEWVATPFSRESSQPKDQTQVSYIAGRLFTS